MSKNKKTEMNEDLKRLISKATTTINDLKDYKRKLEERKSKMGTSLKKSLKGSKEVFEDYIEKVDDFEKKLSSSQKRMNYTEFKKINDLANKVKTCANEINQKIDHLENERLMKKYGTKYKEKIFTRKTCNTAIDELESLVDDLKSNYKIKGDIGTKIREYEDRLKNSKEKLPENMNKYKSFSEKINEFLKTYEELKKELEKDFKEFENLSTTNLEEMETLISRLVKAGVWLSENFFAGVVSVIGSMIFEYAYMWCIS